MNTDEQEVSPKNKEIGKDKIGRRTFYTYSCPYDKNHPSSSFKGKKICSECSKSNHVYMVKTCMHCNKTMKHNRNHYDECTVFNSWK